MFFNSLPVPFLDGSDLLDTGLQAILESRASSKGPLMERMMLRAQQSNIAVGAVTWASKRSHLIQRVIAGWTLAVLATSILQQLWKLG